MAEESHQQFQHNWLYSIVPASSSYSINDKAEVPYLAGFCRVCRKAFTLLLPVDSAVGYYTEIQTNVARWGCVDPTDPNTLF